jgi:hypothetical protein
VGWQQLIWAVAGHGPCHLLVLLLERVQGPLLQQGTQGAACSDPAAVDVVLLQVEKVVLEPPELKPQPDLLLEPPVLERPLPGRGPWQAPSRAPCASASFPHPGEHLPQQVWSLLGLAEPGVTE